MNKQQLSDIKIENDISSINIQRWSDFVLNHPDGNFYQTPGFYNFISEIPSYKPVILAAVSTDGSVVGILTGVIQKEGGLLKKQFSSRLIVWGGPLTDKTDPVITEYLLKALLAFYKGRCIYFEFRNLFRVSDEEGFYRKNKFIYRDHLNFIINTDSEKLTWERISEGKRRQIKKSLANNAKIVLGETIEQVEKFYNILKQLYQTKVKKPLPPWSFFEQFFYHPELGKYFLIEYKDQIVGGIMCPVYDNKIVYEWYIAGEDGIHKGIYPSVLATWAPIMFAGKNGLSQFDFLGAGSPKADYGVREFKRGFGGEMVSFGRYIRVNNRMLYNFGRIGLRMINKIKSKWK